MKKFACYTLGCRANQYQTEVLKQQLTTNSSTSLRASNLQLTTFNDKADIYLINTCIVTHDAERKSRQAIRRAIKQNPKAKIIVSGCYAKLEKGLLRETFPQIEFIIPQSLKPHTPHLKPRIRANLMIQDGCDHFCSYCIVPFARGKIKSKPIKQVVQEAKQLVEAGAREIILTGINLGTYQHDLAKLLKQFTTIPALLRLRLSSIEPMYLTKQLIDAVAAVPKVCHHLHIPLQSGDNQILKSMKRNYSRDDYLEIISYIRKKIPDCGLTTDIIVGFPGENEKEFNNTVNLIDQIKFSRLHIFPYSKRKGTLAATLPNQIDVKTKQQRSQILHKLRAKYMIQFAKKYRKKKVEILVEQKGEGLTSNFIRCFFNDPLDSSGSLKNILARLVTKSGEIRE